MTANTLNSNHESTFQKHENDYLFDSNNFVGFPNEFAYITISPTGFQTGKSIDDVRQKLRKVVEWEKYNDISNDSFNKEKIKNSEMLPLILLDGMSNMRFSIGNRDLFSGCLVGSKNLYNKSYKVSIDDQEVIYLDENGKDDVRIKIGDLAIFLCDKGDSVTPKIRRIISIFSSEQEELYVKTVFFDEVSGQEDLENRKISHIIGIPEKVFNLDEVFKGIDEAKLSSYKSHLFNEFNLQELLS